MTAKDCWHRIMNHFTTAFLITALVIVVNQGSGVTAFIDVKVDQVAAEAKNRAVTIVDGPKYVEPPKNYTLPTNTSAPPPTLAAPPNIRQPEPRPPSKPPLTPDKPLKQNYYVNVPPYYGHIQKIPPRHYAKPPLHYAKPPLQLYHSPNSVYKFPRVIPLPPHLRHHYYVKSRPLMSSASAGKPTYVKSPKFSLPVQTVNGIRADFIKPSKLINTTTSTTTTTTEATTTTKVPRTKRIWPTRAPEKQNSTVHNTTATKDNTTNTDTSAENESDYSSAESFLQIRYGYRNVTTSTVATPSTTRGYRPVTRKLKVKSTTPTNNFTDNDWVPMLPSHYPKLNKPSPTPIKKRSDFFGNSAAARDHMLYLQSFGLVPVSGHPARINARKKMVFFKRKRQLTPYYSGYSTNPVRSPTQYIYGELQSEGSRHKFHRPRFPAKVKHHHHHHHHRYIKTVERPVKVPYRVEVPKPYPVHIEKKVPYPVEKLKVVERPMPYPVTVEKKVPYPIGIKIPYPVPVKVVEKEYVPKPYTIVHHVPVVKHVQVKVPHPVPVAVEKKVPYPVEVKVPVPVDRPVPVPVPYEKQVPYPVAVKVLVPQPYPVETKVPYPVQVKVKEPYEVIRHVKVPYPQPYPVKVPVPVHVEKKVPYPVEVEKRIPVRVEVPVPQRVEVEKKVPVYIPKPYPVEKRIPVPVKVPYPVKVPVKVPVEVPVFIHHPYQVHNDEHFVTGSMSVTEDVTGPPQHTVTVHGNSGFTGFHSRSDVPDTATTVAPLS